MAFSVTILGSSAASPAYGRHHSAQFISIGKYHFLMDCGESAQMQLKRFRCKYSNVNQIFISHLHGDHFFGLIGLISSMHLHGRSDDLHVYGPVGLDEIISTQLRWSQSMISFKLIFHRNNPTEKELIFENEKVSVYSFPLVHRVPCSGFLFKEKFKPFRINKSKLNQDINLLDIANLTKGLDLFDSEGKLRYKNSDLTFGRKKSHSYAYCSDTAYSTDLKKYIDQVELLYHEATFTQDQTERAKQTGHSTASQAAEIAKLVEAKALAIGHFSNRYKYLVKHMEEAKSVFSNSFLALEGRTFEFSNEELIVTD